MEYNRVKYLERNSGEKGQKTPTEKIVNVVQFRQEITKLGIIDIQQIKGLQLHKGTINKQIREKLQEKNREKYFYLSNCKRKNQKK